MSLLGLMLGLPGAPALSADIRSPQVKRAVQRGVEAIRSRQKPDGTWTDHSQPGGSTCLATLALLQAGERADLDPVKSALQAIRRLPDQYVYVTSLKIMVLAKVNPEEYRREIHQAAQWLIGAQNRQGLWSYQGADERFDHSNSQFALLGLHAAAEAGIKIPAAVWQKAQAAVLRTQNGDGGWAYQASGSSYGSMTAAGVADLLVLGNKLHQGQEVEFHNGVAPNCGKYRTNQPLAKGLEWLGRSFRVDTNPQTNAAHLHYWFYAVERCGILSGQRFLGRHDWYREGAEYLVQAQAVDGEWNNNLIDTCFAVLFLAKGRSALLVQKLQWGTSDAWNLDRYDLAHLLAFIGDQLNEPIAWQTVPFEAPLEEWLASPILYVQGHTFPQWNDAQRAKLRAYVEQGGTLLAEACCGRAEFREDFERFAAETFPEAPLHELGPEHAVYHLLHEFKLNGMPAKSPVFALQGIDFGCRTAVIFSPRDFSCLWEQANVPILSDQAFKLGANIAAYAVGRRPLRDRLDVVVLPAPPESQPSPVPAADAFRLAQVVYNGDWRPFPRALANLAEFLRDELKMDVVTQYRQVRLTDRDLYANPVLYLAGHFEFELSEPERTALAAHLRRGGFLIADACCGTEPFDTALRRLLRQVFPDATLERLPPDHPIIVGKPGFNVTSVRYSTDVRREKPDLTTPELWGLRVDGRLVVVYSPYSLGCGLSGPAFDGCWGLASEDARRVAANIVLYAQTH